MRKQQLHVVSSQEVKPALLPRQADEGPFEVGKIYYRPVVIIIQHAKKLAVLHTHKGDITGEWHHHADMRFISDDDCKILGILPTQVFGFHGQVNIMPVMCHRTHCPPITHLSSRDGIAMYRQLEKSCANRTCSNNICPHQGVDLTTVQPNISDNGTLVKTCPCHGLQWDVATGKLVLRNDIQGK